MVLVEGILIFADPELRKITHLRVFVDTDADLRVLGASTATWPSAAARSRR